jgi:hypothetical protein
MLSHVHMHWYSYHIAIFSLLCEAIVKSIPNKTPGDGGEYEEKAYATQHYVTVSPFCVESHSGLSPILG